MPPGVEDKTYFGLAYQLQFKKLGVSNLVSNEPSNDVCVQISDELQPLTNTTE